MIKKEFTAIRLEYATNGEAVSYVLGEHWCSNAAGTGTITKYAVQWAREFRYDGARQRYLNVELDPVALMTAPSGSELPILSITRSDYDGDDVYADWSEPVPGQSGSPALLRSFEPGIGRVEPWTDAGGANTAYYHADMLGTTRMMTGANGLPLPGYGTASMPEPTTFTAFGERVSGNVDGESNRYGYVGEHGYQAHSSSEMPFLHLGARYYDPGLGRFLQRDPIGISGGGNVYAYARSTATSSVDPSGLVDLSGNGERPPPGFVEPPRSPSGPSPSASELWSDFQKTRIVRRMVRLAISCVRESSHLLSGAIKTFSRGCDVIS